MRTYGSSALCVLTQGGGLVGMGSQALGWVCGGLISGRVRAHHGEVWLAAPLLVRLAQLVGELQLAQHR